MTAPRYLMFSYDRYYPLGGMSDLQATGDDLEDLKGLEAKSEYAEIYDTQAGMVIAWASRKGDVWEWGEVDD